MPEGSFQASLSNPRPTQTASCHRRLGTNLVRRQIRVRAAMLRKQLTDRLLALALGNGRHLRCGGLGGELVFRRISFEILIPRLELGKQARHWPRIARGATRRSAA